MRDQRVIAAIDFGSGYTKWAVSDATGVRTGSLVSIAPMDWGYGAFRDVAWVNVRGVSLLVGPGCLDHYEPFIGHRGTAWSRLESTYEAVIRYALSATGVDVIHHLVLGASACASSDVTQFEGSVAVPELADGGKTTRKVRVELVSVVNPATGAFLGAAAHARTLLDDAGSTLLLQLGYSSLLFLAPNNAYTHTGAVMGGMLRVYNDLDRRFSSEIPHARYERALQGTEPLRWNGRKQDFDGQLPFALSRLDVYLHEVMSQIGPLSGVRKLVVTGGAAPLLAPRLQHRYSGLPEAFVPPNPAFASVMGYLASAADTSRDAPLLSSR